MEQNPNLPVLYIENEKHHRLYSRFRRKVYAWLERRRFRPGVRSLILLLPDLLALIIRLFGDRRIAGTLKVQLGVAITYILTPFDLLPDFLTGIGLIDDLAAAAFVLSRVVAIMGQAGEEVLKEHWEGEGDVLDKIREVSNRVESLLRPNIASQIRQLFMK